MEREVLIKHIQDLMDDAGITAYEIGKRVDDKITIYIKNRRHFGASCLLTLYTFCETK